MCCCSSRCVLTGGDGDGARRRSPGHPEVSIGLSGQAFRALHSRCQPRKQPTIVTHSLCGVWSTGPILFEIYYLSQILKLERTKPVRVLVGELSVNLLAEIARD